jgi:hypothetical protein
MTPPKLVVRIGVGLPNLPSVDRVVTDEDATLLEAVVEAAREMREAYKPQFTNVLHGNCECPLCLYERAGERFDAAWARLETP